MNNNKNNNKLLFNSSSSEGLPYQLTDLMHAMRARSPHTNKYLLLFYKWYYTCLLIIKIYNINYYFISGYLLFVCSLFIYDIIIYL